MPDLTVKAFHVRDVDLKATGGGLSIPLPLWNRKEGEVAKAAVAKSQADSELRLLAQQDWKPGWPPNTASMQRPAGRWSPSRPRILKEAAESLRVAQFSYEHGETSLLELLDSRRVYRGTEQDYYKARLDYQLARGGTLAIGRWRCQVMRVRLTKTQWLVIIVVTLSAAGLLGWWYVDQGHDHDQHAGHDHAEPTETKKPEAPAVGQVKPTPEVSPQAKADHDHAQHADTKEPEAPVAGQVKPTPEVVQLGKV